MDSKKLKPAKVDYYQINKKGGYKKDSKSLVILDSSWNYKKEEDP